jgi:hypothetical protein
MNLQTLGRRCEASSQQFFERNYENHEDPQPGFPVSE